MSVTEIQNKDQYNRILEDSAIGNIVIISKSR
jgi:hypothetical protein